MMSNKSEKLRIFLLLCYVWVILHITVFSRNPGYIRIFKGLFWEYRNGMSRDVILNIVLFLPLGFLGKNGRIMIFGFALSFAIEAIQYIGLLGYCEIDDLLHNTVGTMIGYGIKYMAIKGLKRWMEKERNK